MIFDMVFAQTDRLVAEPSQTTFYFVAAHTIDGARFYSETFEDVISVIDVYHEYESVVSYFGGGIVELFRIDEKDFDIISTSRV